MALEDLTPAVRVEEILDGADIEPATRLEYFMKKAANEVPKPAGSADAGKVVTVNEDGDGFELDDVPEELPAYTSADKGKVLTIGEGEGSVTTVIVPEQTVTVAEVRVGMYAASISNFSFDTLSNSDAVVLTVNGTSYEGVAEVDGDNVTVEPESSIYGITGSENDGAMFYTSSAGTYTVSLVKTVPSVEPKWEAAGGGIEFFPVTTTASAHTAAITAGKMQEILLAGKVPVGIAVYNEDPVNTYIIGGVAAGKAGYNVIVIGSLTPVTVNELTDYPVLWRS